MDPIDRRRDIADIASTARSLDPTPPPLTRAPPRAAETAAHALLAFDVAPRDFGAVAGNASTAPSRSVSGVAPAVVARVVQARLDAVRVAASGPYRVPGAAGPVFAPAHFRMNGGFNQRAAEERAIDLAVACRGKVPAYEVQFARWGRASPSALARITQALIDAGKLPGPEAGPPGERVRAMQWAYGIGFDCAGYVQQALLAVHGLSGSVRDRTSIGLAPAVGNEGFIDMNAPAKREKFRRVAIADATPGSIVKLDAPPADAARGEPGHVVIVYSNRTDAEGARNALAHFYAKGRAEGDAAARFMGRGSVRAVEVDSSWGAEDGRPFGGVRRDVWLHDDTTGDWGYYTPHGAAGFRISRGGPAGEVFGGAFEGR